MALHGIDLEVSRGELLMIVGPSGCGPVTAIFALEDLPEKWTSFTQKNAEYYEKK
jgi:ABC-type nitrate/sulfonate/bicarbonate transport system ATPase subunit